MLRAMDFSIQVGKYDIQQLLGKGATGTVYHAIDTFSGMLDTRPRDDFRRENHRTGPVCGPSCLGGERGCAGVDRRDG